MAMSCNYYKACFQAGTTAVGAIISNLNTCCSTGVEVCKKATEATLPADCHPDVSTVNLMRSVGVKLASYILNSNYDAFSTL